jgi:SAM-dependent methyltransferase
MTRRSEPDSHLGATSLAQLVRERRTRDAIYHAANYWDARAASRDGLARSVWPSNVFNTYWDARQRELLTRALGDMHGRRVADVGCGTGRMTRFFADAGASEVVGIDFSPAKVESAEAETRVLRGASASVASVAFVVGDVVASLDHVGAARFDDAVVLGCLSVACRDLESLERALMNIRRLVKPGGRVVLLEPIHRSRLLRRILKLSVAEWVSAASRAGLALRGTDRMGFAPVRLVFAVRDLPHAIVGRAFGVGERLLDLAPWLAPLSDYKLLLFQADGDVDATRA